MHPAVEGIPRRTRRLDEGVVTIAAIKPVIADVMFVLN